MYIHSISAAALALVSLTQAAALQARDLLQDLQDQALQNLQDAESNSAVTKRSCSVFNAEVRRDWAWMSSKERKAYIKAVQCLFASPSKSDPAKVPGARNRFDDFVAQHIDQAISIHGTGNFLSWHRYFVFGYEKALREECGYMGSQPYWNWFTHQDNLRASPVFDGSDTSMGGDGAFVPHNGSVGGAGLIPLPSGEGGGCIESGPFKGVQLNLGPVSPTMAGEVKVNSTFAYNPRCLKRDLTTFASSNWLTLENLYNVTLGAASANIATFQNELQGRFAQGFLGMHAAGHFAIGGDAGDLFSSPNDPVFFLHHAMVDRVWWIWQALHLDQAKTIAGTITIDNNPPSRNASLDDIIHTDSLNLDDRKIGDLLGTLDGTPFCYTYL
ncbi:Di-copper centre-containing protein [Sporormia fimetaria CBS 119925]|uniref:Di-copper centre-containing protein n=1 Tax=Sporormia fimetaria CBS 119925 TaxID=1340428 RepID=A0A6A6V0K1_9PLEO|nr:Di-copper centre-containing protein [Sporormia fimetaria CBS 119925]